MQQEESGASHQTMVISRSDIALEQTYPASVEGRQSIRMIPRVEGYLAEIRIHEEQRVSKGQVLFVIDQATYKAELSAAQANVQVAQAGVESAQLAYDSRKQLREKDIVSDFDLQSAATQLALAKAQLTQAQAQLESARSNLSYTELTSPSDGVVRLCTLSGVRHQLGMTLDEVESQLDPQRFMRVNRQKNAALGSFPNASFLPIWKYPGDRWQTWRSR